MTIVQWNCRGFRANRPDIDLLIQDLNPIAFCLQETLIREPVSLKGYVPYHKHARTDDFHRPHGGVSIFVQQKIPQRNIPLNTNLEAVATRVTLNNKTITICSIYNRPSLPLKSNELFDLTNQLPMPFIMLGDFNAHNILWGGNNTDPNGREVENLINLSSLCLWNTGSPTYIHPGSGSQTSIDLSICSPSIYMDFTWTVGDSTLGSDHLPIFIKPMTPYESSKIPHWQFSKADWTKFKTICEAQLTNTDFLISADPIETFTEQLHDIALKCIPKSSTKSCQPKKPWFDEECNRAIKQRNKALHKFYHSPTVENHNNYKLLRAKCRKLIKDKKKETWRNYVSGLSYRTPARHAWNMIGKMTGKPTEPHINHLFVENNEVSTCKDIANTLASTFAKNSSSNNYTSNFRSYKTQTERKSLNFVSNNAENYNSTFSLRELQSSLHYSKNTASGPDDIQYQILKNLPYSGMLVLLSIFNHIWEKGPFPPSWRKAMVIAIPKPGKDNTEPNNHRPIALTSCICKTMERMINKRLTWYLEVNNILTNHQAGFRQGRSTIDQLVRLETSIRDAFVNKQHLVAIFFDLEKAYDTTWKYGIMRDLHNMGLRGRLPLFIDNFLKDRTFQVRLGRVLSNIHEQEMGVPQGSVLSVTLFSIKINNIIECLLPETHCSLYVDDFLICCKSSYMPAIERRLQGCLNKLQVWTRENGFRFSSSKTVCVHFCRGRKLHTDPVLHLDNLPIPVVEKTKFLGIIFDKKLNFIAHLKYIKSKCQKALNILKVAGHYKWGADRVILLNIYRAIVRAKMDYGLIVYGSACASYRKMLHPIQNQGLRICLGAFRTSSAEALCVEANETPFEIRRVQLSLQYALKLKGNPTNPAYYHVFHPEYEETYARKPSYTQPLGIRIKQELEETEIDLNAIRYNFVPDFPPWHYTPPKIDQTLTEFKKSSTNPVFFKQKFYEMKERYREYEEIYTDGSKHEGKVASAALAGDRIFVKRLPDNSSIFSAELTAILLALKYANDTNHDRFLILSDSLSSLQALNGFDMTNPLLQDVIFNIIELENTNKIIAFCWIPSHIGIRGNETVDHIAKAALTITHEDYTVPYTDFKAIIKQHTIKRWQNLWDQSNNTKLKLIKPNVNSKVYPPHTLRQEDIVLTRLRIGHTYLTHSYLLKGEDPPKCIPCQEPLTVKHILLDCQDFDHIRTLYFHANTIKDLFDSVDSKKIIGFIKQIGLFAMI